MRLAGIGALLALTLGVLAQCAPVRADVFDSYDPALVMECAARAGADEDSLRACIGAGARPCIEADGSATSSHVLCWSHEAETWRALMDGATVDLNTRHTHRDPERLLAANAAWERWAEAECEYWAWEEGGGAGEQVDRARCAGRLTAERAIALIHARASR